MLPRTSVRGLACDCRIVRVAVAGPDGALLRIRDDGLRNLMGDIDKVLLVDDDEDIRTIGEMALSEVGQLPTLLASHAEQALAIAAAEQPSVILLDVMMPGVDGITTFRRLLAQSSTASIPVIFVTAKVQRHEVQHYLELGAVGVICKPFDPMTLSDQLRQIMEGAPSVGSKEKR